MLLLILFALTLVQARHYDYISVGNTDIQLPPSTIIIVDPMPIITSSSSNHVIEIVNSHLSDHNEKDKRTFVNTISVASLYKLKDITSVNCVIINKDSSTILLAFWDICRPNMSLMPKEFRFRSDSSSDLDLLRDLYISIGYTEIISTNYTIWKL